MRYQLTRRITTSPFDGSGESITTGWLWHSSSIPVSMLSCFLDGSHIICPWMERVWYWWACCGELLRAYGTVVPDISADENSGLVYNGKTYRTTVVTRKDFVDANRENSRASESEVKACGARRLEGYMAYGPARPLHNSTRY